MKEKAEVSQVETANNEEPELQEEAVASNQDELNKYKTDYQILQKKTSEKESMIKELAEKLEKSRGENKFNRIKESLTRKFLANQGKPEAVEDALVSLMSLPVEYDLGEDQKVNCKVQGEEKTLDDVITAFLEKKTYFKKRKVSQGSGLKMDSGRSSLKEASHPVGIDSKEARFNLAKKIFRY